MMYDKKYICIKLCVVFHTLLLHFAWFWLMYAITVNYSVIYHMVVYLHLFLSKEQLRTTCFCVLYFFLSFRS